MRSENKVLDGLSYISILFAPFFFPFIVWILTPKGSASHFHAGRAFKLHLIPLLLTLAFVIFVSGISLSFGHDATAMQSLGVGSMIFIGVVLIADFVLGIYSIYYGIKVFLS